MIYATLLRTSVVTIITFKWLFSSWTDATCLVMVYSFENSCSHKCHIWKAFSFHELVKHVCVFTSIFRYSYSHRCHTWMVFFFLYELTLLVYSCDSWEELYSQMSCLNGFFPIWNTSIQDFSSHGITSMCTCFCHIFHM